jgi:NAD+-dependent protein deacetylase sirtuin 5
MTSAAPSTLSSDSLSSFHTHLANSTRIVAILGAGLSAPSGLATFRATDGLWANHDVHLVATPAGWRRDPGLVWQFYSGRRPTPRISRWRSLPGGSPASWR